MPEKKVITVNPYLTFPGNCREAMTFYKDALAGELDVMTFEGAPVDVPEEYETFEYPNVEMVGDRVFVRYYYGKVGYHVKDVEDPEDYTLTLDRWPDWRTCKNAGLKGKEVLEIYPLEWFYN